MPFTRRLLSCNGLNYGHGEPNKQRDDWCLELPNGDAVARIYKVRGGPRDGHSFWAVQIDERLDRGTAARAISRRAARRRR